MPKTGSSKLFDLIRSMTKTEKAQFKIFAGKGKKSEIPVYIQLFSVIENQTVYDEQKVLRSMSKLSPSHFAVVKNHLYDLILYSLTFQHVEDTVDSRLKLMSLQFDVLFNKGLYDQCEKLLAKAKKIAYKYFYYQAVVDLLDKEKRLMSIKSLVGVSEKELAAVFSATFNAIENIQNQEQYRQIENAIGLQTHFLSGQLKTAGQKQAVKKIMSSNLLRSENNALNINSKIFYNTIHSLYNCFVTDDLYTSSKYSTRFVELLEAHPHRIQEKPNEYIAGLHNMSAVNGQLGKYAEAFKGVAKMRTFSEKYNTKLPPTLNARVFLNSYSLELAIICHSCRFEKLHNIIEKLEAGLNEYKKIIPASSGMFDLMYNVSYVYFCLGNYKKSLEWINKLLNSSPDVPRNVISVSKISALILHYELGNSELLPYTIKSTYRFLTKSSLLHKTEPFFLNFMKAKLVRPNSAKELMKIFKELKKELEKLFEDPGEKQTYEFLLHWAESKIENKTFAEIVREKTQSASPLPVAG